MRKLSGMIPGLLGLVLLGILALVLASQAMGQGGTPGAQGYPGPLTPTPDAVTAMPTVGPDDGIQPTPINTTVPALPESFDPQTYGLPEVIAGYEVLAVLTSDNQACLPPGQNRLVLQSAHPTLEDYLSEQDGGQAPDVGTALEELGLNLAEWTWSIGGPYATRDKVIQDIQEWNLYAQQHGCSRSGPMPTESLLPHP